MDSPTIALVTETRYVDQPCSDDQWYLSNIFLEDRLLSESLLSHGFKTERVAWSDVEVGWQRYQGVVIRTTWDYYERAHEFGKWVAARELDSKLINSPSTIRWNIDKHYLRDLENNGIAIVPTQFIEKGTLPNLDTLLGPLDTEEAVLKPCISGGAYHTYRLPVRHRTEWEKHITDLTPNMSMMIQPFQKHILTEGEITLVVMNGKVTHGVRKVAKAGDYRVQDDHGGRVSSHQPTGEEIAFAESVVAACKELPVYARVDMVRGNNGQLQVMELELVEPELWMRFHPASADPFARGIVSRLLNEVIS